MVTVETICIECPMRGKCDEPCEAWYDALEAEYLKVKDDPK